MQEKNKKNVTSARPFPYGVGPSEFTFALFSERQSFYKKHLLK